MKDKNVYILPYFSADVLRLCNLFVTYCASVKKLWVLSIIFRKFAHLKEKTKSNAYVFFIALSGL